MAARRMAGMLLMAAAAGLLALLGWGLGHTAAGTGSPGVNAAGSAVALTPRPAGAIQLHLFAPAGASWRLADQQGQLVVVNFWASWCTPCRSEAGVLAQAAHDYQARGIRLVGVNLWDEPGAARAFLSEFGITYPNGQDTSGTLGVEYGVTGIPETFVIDGRGTVRRRWIGPVTRTTLDALLPP